MILWKLPLRKDFDSNYSDRKNPLRNNPPEKLFHVEKASLQQLNNDFFISGFK